MAARAVVVRAERSEPRPWEEAAGAGPPLALDRASTEEAGARLREAECALVDGMAPEPVSLARRVRSLDPTLQVAIVVPPADAARVRKAMLFAPGLGEVWIVPPEEVGPGLVERAGAVTRQRRSYRATHARIEHDLAGIEPQAARRAAVSDAYLAALLHVLPDPVISIDPAGRVLSWNPAAERLLGRKRRDAVGRSLGEALRAEDPEALGRLVEAAEEAPARGEIRFRRQGGEEGVGEVAIVPVVAAEHRVRAVVLWDVTEERRTQAEMEAQAAELEAAQLELEMSNDDLQRINAELAEREERKSFLSEVGRVLAVSLDYRETLRSVARLAVPRIADWCAVDVLEEGKVRRLAVVHSDPAREELAHEAERRWPTDPSSPTGVPHVLRTGEPELYPEIPDELLRAAARDEEHLRVLREVGLRSAMIVPLVAPTGILGALTLISAESGRRYGADDLAFAEQLASRASLAVENARLFRDVQAAHEAAERSRAEAEAANRAKSEFLATMSHEIRTPINAIIGYTDLLELGIAGPVTERQKEQLGRVRMSSQHLLGLIEDVLDLAKVEAGRIEVAHERALAVNAIAEALALVSPQAAEQGITVEAPCTDDPGVSYVGDEDRVRQILVNLLSNAVKFTEPGGRITITCATEAVPAPEAEAPDGGRWTCIRVTDTGIGIAPEDMDKVFRPFEQVEEGRTRTRGGTGLGLTISRDLARLMGGDLTVRSERGEGSTFTLWLPGEAALRPSLDESVLERTRQGRPRGLAEAGEAVQDQMDSILSAYVARLRRDPLVPRAAPLGRVNLEDHASSFLSDIAQSLVSLASGEVDVADLLRDGTEIQQLISKLHGAQRARLGWTEVALRREFAILREETEAAVRRKLSPGEADVDEAVGLLHRFFEHAERVSLRGLRSSIPAGGG